MSKRKYKSVGEMPASQDFNEFGLGSFAHREAMVMASYLHHGVDEALCQQRAIAAEPQLLKHAVAARIALYKLIVLLNDGRLP